MFDFEYLQATPLSQDEFEAGNVEDFAKSYIFILNNANNAYEMQCGIEPSKRIGEDEITEAFARNLNKSLVRPLNILETYWLGKIQLETAINLVTYNPALQHGIIKANNWESFFDISIDYLSKADPTSYPFYIVETTWCDPYTLPDYYDFFGDIKYELNF